MQRFLLMATLCLLTAGCATAPLNRAGSLASYDGLTPSDGVLTKSIVRVDKEDVLGAKTVRLVETRFSSKAAAEVSFSPEQRKIIGNAIDRALCFGLSDRFQIVDPADQADLTIQAVITHAAATDSAAAGASGVARVAKAVLLPGVPVPVPRIPLGLGSLSVEGEARDRRGQQKAAMVWGRGRILSQVLPAYRLMAMPTTFPRHLPPTSADYWSREYAFRNPSSAAVAQEPAHVPGRCAEASGVRSVRKGSGTCWIHRPGSWSSSKLDRQRRGVSIVSDCRATGQRAFACDMKSAKRGSPTWAMSTRVPGAGERRV